ncbi:vasculin-like protein 1 [Spea bombifrons]|uniref:vasculin-like protein 1 n=1 Tax=Spea bombifrons TaxID=233779 RepID=UPI00234AC7BF|nr:vasculin-like protein 1 [Spea bombifrons]XP_053325609.1 vasculin-like protein 1 [Spea bombifrons]
MAQHDFVPAWLNFSTPQSTKPSSGIVEKHGEHLPRGEGRLGVSRRRHNSSDGFFNNGTLRTTGDSWHQPSFMRHDSVDSGVSKGFNVSTQSSWHGGPRGQEGSVPRGGGNGSGAGNPGHRHRNGTALSRKNTSLQEKQTPEAREEKNAERKKPQFEEEDFPSLNPETSKHVIQSKQTGTGVWENPPTAKQPTKMLVIKKISKEDPSAFSAAFASPVPHLSNGGTKTSPSGPIVYKNLVPKSALSSAKPGAWKSNGRDSKPGSLFSNRDSAFTSPVLATKPLVQAPTPLFSAPKEGTASVTPPLELSISRLSRMTRRVPDKKSEFLRTLKDEQDADQTEDRDSDKLEEVRGPSDLNGLEGEHSEESFHHNGITGSQEERREKLSYSLEAEHRLLKEMGWQESPENDEDCLPLTEAELQEFQVKSQQLRRNGMGQNGFLRQPRRCALLFAWRGPLTPDPSECSDTDTSSTDTSDDES